MLNNSNNIMRPGLLLTLLMLACLSTNLHAGTYVVIGNAENNVDKSDARKEVRRLYLKVRPKWSNGHIAETYDRASGTPEHNAFREVVLGMKKDQLSNHWLRVKQRTGETPPRVIGSSKSLVRMVGKKGGGFGVLNEEDSKDLPNSVRILFSFSN